VIKAINNFECDLICDGHKKRISISISNSFPNKKINGGWYTYVKISPFLDNWTKIFGSDSWQSLILAISFITRILSNYSDNLYFKDTNDKLPFEEMFIGQNCLSRNTRK
jgi:hypothetical protein